MQGDFIHYWSTWVHGWFRPLVSVSIWVDQHIWGLAPWGYHLSNLLLQWFNSVLVGWVFIQLVRLFTKETFDKALLRWGAVAACIFAILPCHAESVSWIADRTDLLASFFALVAVSFYLGARIKGRIPWLGWICFALALATKESVVVIPPALFLIEIALGKTQRSLRTWFYLGFWFVMVLAYIPIRSHFVGALIGGYGVQAFRASPVFLLEQPFLSLGHIVFPGLLPLHSWFKHYPFETWRHLNLALFLFAGLSVLLVQVIWAQKLQPRRLSWILLGASLVSLLPSLSFGIASENNMSERLLYLSSAWLAIWMVVHIRKIWAHKTILRLGVVGLALLWILGSSAGAFRWYESGHSTKQILDKLVELPINNSTILIGLPDNHAGAYMFRGDADDAMQFVGSKVKPVIPAGLSSWEYDDSFSLSLHKDTLLVRATSPWAQWIAEGAKYDSMQVKVEIHGSSLGITGSGLNLENCLIWQHKQWDLCSHSLASQVVR